MMHVVGLQHYDAETARNSGALVLGAKVLFRYYPGSKKHPESYVAYCGGLKIGNMPLFGLKVLAAANCPSPVTSVIRQVSDDGVWMSVIVDIDCPLEASPDACRITTPSTELSGVYAIVNVRNMKVYIGRAKNCNRRRISHVKQLDKGIHPKTNLQRDWQADAASFAFVVLDPTPPDLDQQERYRQKLYKSKDPAVGYNHGEGFSPGEGFTSPVQSRHHSGGWQQSSSRQHDYFAVQQEDDGFDADDDFSTTQTRGPAGLAESPQPFSRNQLRPPPTTSPINQQSGCLLFVAFFAGCICVALGVFVLATFA
jgi:hypothetical protein